ncbi:MAG: TolC family outer membrane protein [Gammaproteobacteria bacterium]|nr:TolC family outer membrane protein [Gammaproteobacteria bacterium]
MNDRLFYRILMPGALVFGQLFNPASAIELANMVADSISAHPQVKEKVHVYRQVLADQEIAQSGWHPSVDLDVSTGFYETESPSTGGSSVDYDSTRLELSVTQNLFNGYDTTHQIELTRARARAALLDLYDTADNIALDAIQAYLDVLKQRRLLELALENVYSHEEILSQIRERNSSGVGRRSQLQQTEGRVARAHASLMAQQNNLQDSLSLLHQILGRYVEPTDLSVPDLPLLPSSDLNSLIDKALINHPAMQVAQSNIKAAYADHSRSLNTRYPNLDLRFAYETGNDIGGIIGDTDELSLTLNLTYNFYRGGADTVEQRQKISVAYEQKEFAARVRRQVINTLRLAWIGDVSLNKQLVFLEKHITKVDEAAVSYREEFFIGQRDLIDLLDVENELNSARNQHTDTYFDALAARYRVYEALGLAFETLGLEVNLSENNLQITSIEANAADQFPLPEDEDSDQENDWTDHCDNSLSNSQVNPYGCTDVLPVAITSPVHVNSAPTPGNDNFEVDSNSILVLSITRLLANDTDADNDPLKFVDISNPENGKLAFNKNRDLIYLPNEGYSGIDVFTYTVSDDHGATAVATATVRIKVRASVEIDLSKIQLVNFKYNESELTEISRIKVLRIIEKVKSVPDIQIMIRTFTDSSGSEVYNLALSQRRAAALELLLNKHNISSDSIVAKGMGEKNPLADNSTRAGQAINRRGEFVFNLPPTIN